MSGTRIGDIESIQAEPILPHDQLLLLTYLKAQLLNHSITRQLVHIRSDVADLIPQDRFAAAIEDLAKVGFIELEEAPDSTLLYLTEKAFS